MIMDVYLIGAVALIMALAAIPNLIIKHLAHNKNRTKTNRR